MQNKTQERWNASSTVARRVISPTFDDGPDPVWTPRVLAELRRVRARATFFVITPRAQRYPNLISEMLAAGHGVELHCFAHIRHTELSREEIEADTRAGLEDLTTLGVRPRLWRTPWGVTTPATAEVASRFGLDLVPWTADTHDWRGDSATSMLARTEPLLHPGTVVLMHDGLGPGARRSGCEQTVALIQPLVEAIRDRGCEPSPVAVPLAPAREVPA